MKKMQNWKYMFIRRFFTIFLFVVVASVSDVWAQFTVEDDTKKQTAGEVTILNQLQNIDASTEYYSAAKAHLERLRLRKERNTLELTFKLQGIDSGVEIVSSLSDAYVKKYDVIKLSFDKHFVDRYTGIDI